MIRNIRNEFDLSQKEIADVIGVTRQNVSQIENHHRKLSREGAERISDYVQSLGAIIPPDLILGCQWHKWCTQKLDPIKDEAKSPAQKVDLLSDVLNVLKRIENFEKRGDRFEEAYEEMREGARKKRQDVEEALERIESWTEKSRESFESPDITPDITEELAKIG